MSVIKGVKGFHFARVRVGVNYQKFMQKFENKIWLSSPTMHGEEIEFVKKAYDTNWMSTVGENINVIEKLVADLIGQKDAVALSCGTAALHMAVKLAGVKKGDTVFCSDTTFSATVNPVVYEGALPVFIDSEKNTWNMDPIALEKAFNLYPNTKVVIVADLYGTPADYDGILSVVKKHGAILISDAAESLGAKYDGKPTGSFGDINAISFNGNKIITGSSGGMLLTNDHDQAVKVRKWSTQSRDDAPWYQHTELGYNYRMSNVIAGVVRGQLPHLREHVERKKEIYFRYEEGFKDLPVSLNPYGKKAEPNFWLTCLLIDKTAMAKQTRTDKSATFIKEKGKTCPTEILEKLADFNAEGRPIWKPMHMQPIFKGCPFVKVEASSVGEDVFNRGLCLPSDIKMTKEEQDGVIEIVRSCFM